MTQENRELLLKDLSARLPYGVKIQESTLWYEDGKETWRYKDIDLTIDNINSIIIDFIKPYLFPLSSMTEEQEKECQQIKYSYYYDDDSFVLFDWYNKNHFDYRGLIPMGLAIDCTNLNIY